jgi:hypothetical protein
VNSVSPYNRLEIVVGESALEQSARTVASIISSTRLSKQVRRLVGRVYFMLGFAGNLILAVGCQEGADKHGPSTRCGPRHDRHAGRHCRFRGGSSCGTRSFLPPGWSVPFTRLQPSFEIGCGKAITPADLKLRDMDDFQNLASVFNNMQATLLQRSRDDHHRAAIRVRARWMNWRKCVTGGTPIRTRVKELLKNLAPGAGKHPGKN